MHASATYLVEVDAAAAAVGLDAAAAGAGACDALWMRSRLTVYLALTAVTTSSYDHSGCSVITSMLAGAVWVAAAVSAVSVNECWCWIAVEKVVSKCVAVMHQS